MPTTLSSEQPAAVVPAPRTHSAPNQRCRPAAAPTNDQHDGDDRTAGDAELMDAVREGQIWAYGLLFRRHRTAAENLARQLAKSATEADDLVAEAFLKVLDVLRDGRGPETAFRAYLLTALRHHAYDKTRRARKIELTDCVETKVRDMNPDAMTDPFRDTAVAGLEQSLAARAFARLPERWQKVLWHTEIEEMTPAEVAPLMALTPNGVSALAYRAREGLRQAYLQVYVAEPDDQPAACREATGNLGPRVRSGLAKREAAKVDAHLAGCTRCRAVAAELRQELP